MSKSTFRDTRRFGELAGWKRRECDKVLYKRSRLEKHKRSGRP
jgi:hypothetical protein